MTTEAVLYLIVFAHWVSDFIMQTSAQAKNKSSSNTALISHIVTYSIWLAAFLGTRCEMSSVLKFALVNGAIHFVVDYFTSRMTSKLWKEQRVHDFFVVIGADQALHMTTLIYTSSMLVVR